MIRAFHNRGSRINLVNAVVRGDLPIETAAALAGISLRQLLSWLREHKASTEPSLDDLRLSDEDRRLRALRRRVHLLETRLAAARLERAQLLRLLTSATLPAIPEDRPQQPGADIPFDMGMSRRSNGADPLTGSFR